MCRSVGDKLWKGEAAAAAVYATLAPSSDIIRRMRSSDMGATDKAGRYTR